jgi:hypothetical protein
MSATISQGVQDLGTASSAVPLTATTKATVMAAYSQDGRPKVEVPTLQSRIEDMLLRLINTVETLRKDVCDATGKLYIPADLQE